MRWGVVPILFCLAGAAGGALEARLSEVLIGRFADLTVGFAVIGAALGLTVGMAMCVSRRPWLSAALSPVLGLGGFAVLLAICALLDGHPLPSLSQLFREADLLCLTLPSVPLLVLTHHGYLRAMKRGRTPFLGLPIYGVAGALSHALIWYRGYSLGVGLLSGALFGLLQHVAMMIALGLEKWRAEPESAQGFSPRQ